MNRRDATRLLLTVLAPLPAWGGPSGCGGSETLAGEDAEPLCTVELRSWVVLGRGRHLYLRCECPPSQTHLDGVVEYTKVSLRRDYAWSRGWGGETGSAAGQFGGGAPLADGPGMPPPIGRMTRGAPLRPILAEPRDRLEFTYRAPASVVERLQRDVVFTEPYRLLGPNSNSGLRWVMEEAGLRLPGRVVRSGGVLGEFPGIGMSPGEPIGAEAWAGVGLPGGPTAPEAPAES